MENEEFEREMNYKSPSQVMGDAVAKEFADGQEEEEEEVEITKYLTVLDSEVSRVFQYKVESSDFGPHLLEYYDKDDFEDFLTNNGHNLANCQWMVHDQPHIWARHNVEQVEASRLYNYKLNTIANG